MNLVSIAIWLGLIIFLSAVIDLVLRQVFRHGGYRILVAPGIIVHELSHAFACLITRTKVKEIAFFHHTGGYVKHEKSKIPFLGSVIISLAPLVVGIILVFVLSKFLITDHNVQLELSLSANNLSKLLKTILSINLFSIINIVIFYLLISISITMAPSFKDFTNALIGLIFVLFVLLFINYFFTIRLSETILLITFSLVSIILIVTLVFSMILYVIKSMFG